MPQIVSMKKSIIAAILLTVTASAGFAQGFYFRAGIGYAFPQAGQTLDGTSQPYNGTLNDSTLQYKLKNTSFSAGLGSFIGFGYMFSEHVGIQLDGNIGFSTRQYTYTESNYNYLGVPSRVSVVQQAKTPFILIPSLVVHSGGDPLDAYCRFGLALPVSTNISEDQVVVNNPGTGALTQYDFTLKIKNSFSLGFSAAAGVRYKISDKVCVWGEMSLLSLAVFIKQSDVVGFSYNGQPQSLSAIIGSLTTKYSKNIVADTSNTARPAYAQPFSNLGIHAGISVNLSHSNGHSSGRRHENEDIDPNKPFRRR